MEEVIKLNSVDQYNKMYGLETLHPLVTVVDLSKATVFPTHFTLNYGLYALFLKQTSVAICVTDGKCMTIRKAQ